MKFEWFVGRRYFKSRPTQKIIALITLLSIAGVIIGVTALVVVIGVMAGFESDLKSRIMGIQPHLIIDRDGAVITDYEDIVKLSRQVEGVKAAWPAIEFDAMLRANGRAAGALVKGVLPEEAAKGLDISSLSRLDLGISGTVIGNDIPPTYPPVIIGRDLAHALGVYIDDTLFVVSPKMTLAPTGFFPYPYMKRFRIAGFFSTGMYEYDGRLIFMRLEDAQALFKIGQGTLAIEIRANDPFKIPTISENIKKRLRDDFRFRDWQQLNRNLFSYLKLEKVAMFITLTLIIIVATFSIASSLVMLVMEKTKDIAILKTMGATSASIKRIFILQGMLIGFIGTCAGVTIGATVCYLQKTYQLIHLPDDVFIISTLPVDLHVRDVVFVALSALIICFVATLYPAHQASRFKPVEALRYG